MKTRPIVAGAVAFLVICVSPVFGASARPSQAAVSPLASVRVVGSGPIVWSSVAARTSPSLDAPVIRTLGQFRPDFHPRWVMAVDAKRDANGVAKWYQLVLAGRPNGQKGWVPASSVSIKPVDRWLVIYRASRRFEFYIAGRVVHSGRVAVGAPGMETPVGLFFVQSKFVPQRSPILGAFAFETSGYSKLSDWPGGGVVGVHGTRSPELIGQAVSHGCVRLDNRDVLYLRSRVGLGTPVKIVAA